METTVRTPPDYHDKTTATPQPVTKANRIQAIDLLRGVALLGILMMNIPGFGYGELTSWLPTILHQKSGLDFYVFEGIDIALQATMRALFSILFGAGMLLFTMNKTDGTNGTTVAEYYYRRLLWLILFGMFNAYILLWDGDILFEYGICGLVLFPFRWAKPVWLVGMALLCLGVSLIRPLWSYSEVRANRAGYVGAVQREKAHQKLTEEQTTAKAAWEKFAKSFEPDTRKDAKELKAMRGSYGTAFVHRIPDNSYYESTLIYTRWWAAATLMMMFLGMALLKWGFFSNQLPISTYVLTLLIGYGLGLPISWVYVQGKVAQFTDIGQFVDTYRVSTSVLYELRRVLLVLGHASLLLLICRTNVLPGLLRALTAVGQMAFTNYLMQSIICTLFFNGYGLGYFGQLAFHELYYVVVGVWVFQLIVSPIWLRHFRFGRLSGSGGALPIGSYSQSAVDGQSVFYLNCHESNSSVYESP